MKERKLNRKNVNNWLDGLLKAATRCPTTWPVPVHMPRWHQTRSNMYTRLGANPGGTAYYAQPEARRNPCNDTA